MYGEKQVFMEIFGNKTFGNKTYGRKLLIDQKHIGVEKWLNRLSSASWVDPAQNKIEKPSTKCPNIPHKKIEKI